MHHFRIFFLILSFWASGLYAQQISRTDTILGTPLNMTMDSRLDSELKKLESNCSRTASATPGRRTSVSDDADEAPTRPTRVVVASRPLTQAEICARNPRISGYKIQVAVVKSNEDANKVKAYFRSKFPRLKVEVDASLRPNYKILAGSYFNRGSATGDLGSIKAYFKDAIPVQKMIFCAEGK